MKNPVEPVGTAFAKGDFDEITLAAQLFGKMGTMHILFPDVAGKMKSLHHNYPASI